MEKHTVCCHLVLCVSPEESFGSVSNVCRFRLVLSALIGPQFTSIFQSLLLFLLLLQSTHTDAPPGDDHEEPQTSRPCSELLRWRPLGAALETFTLRLVSYILQSKF